VVISGSALTVAVQTVDCERLPISRGGQLLILSISAAKVATLQHQGGAWYAGAVPDSWIREPGAYNLTIESIHGAETVSSLRIPFEVRCGDSEEKDLSGRCRPRCKDEPGFNWLDAKANACKKRPEMALKAASDKLSITHTKALSNPVSKSTVEVRLASGDVDGISAVEWIASSSAGWLRLGQSNGTVNSDAPVAQMNLVLDSTGLNDTGVASLLRANITVVSRMAGRSDLFDKGTHLLTMEVQVAILAVPSVTRADVRIQRSSGEDLMDGGSVVSGDALIITANTFDYERLPISREGLQLTVHLVGGRDLLKLLEMRYREGNTYRSEVPSSWLEKAGSYSLNISNTVEIRFEVSKSNRSVYIGAAIASVRWGWYVLHPWVSLHRRVFMRAAAWHGVYHHGRPFVQESATCEGVYKLVCIL
jgi:hypothetical protein